MQSKIDNVTLFVFNLKFLGIYLRKYKDGKL